MLQRKSALLLIAVLALGACGKAPTVSIPNYDPAKPELCARLVASLPGEVLAQGRRQITNSEVSEFVAAWGDPIIVLQCGVAKPASEVLLPDLLTVNEIDWRYEELTGGTRFYSDSLQVNIRIDVPSDYGNPTGVLVDLSASLAAIKN